MSAVQSHISVLLAEAVDALAIRADGIYVDGTFGRGGHSRAVLERLGPAGRLIAFDRDPAAIEAGQALNDPRLTLVHSAFSALDEELAQRGVATVDGVLLDLGVSSPQLDDGARGMSFRFDAPLDMRMDTSRGQTVADTDPGEMARVLGVHAPAQKRRPGADVRVGELGDQQGVAHGCGVYVYFPHKSII